MIILVASPCVSYSGDIKGNTSPLLVERRQNPSSCLSGMSRRSARQLPATLDRLLRSNTYLKTPPPAFYPMLAHPPPPSLIRQLSPRSEDDLPLNRKTPKSAYILAKVKRDNGELLTREQQAILDNPNPTPKRNFRKSTTSTKFKKIEEIEFPEDVIRKLFFRDHPFEAYRPKTLVEGQDLRAEEEPKRKAWTELCQRTIFPTAEDAIAFCQTLKEHHGLSLSDAYVTAVTQFRTLRSEAETAQRSARLEAEAHGAEFFGELERGMMVEDRALEAWKDARVIQEQYMSVGKLQAAKGISSRDSELAVMREVSRRRQSSQSRPNTLGIWDTMGDSGSSVKNDNAGLNSMSTAHTASEDEFSGGLHYMSGFRRFVDDDVRNVQSEPEGEAEAAAMDGDRSQADLHSKTAEDLSAEYGNSFDTEKFGQRPTEKVQPTS